MGVGDVVGADVGMAGMIEAEDVDVDADECTGSVLGNTGDTEDEIVAVGEDVIEVVEEDTVVAAVELDAVVAVEVRIPMAEGVADEERDVGGVTDLLHDCLLLCIDFEYASLS